MVVGVSGRSGGRGVGTMRVTGNRCGARDCGHAANSERAAVVVGVGAAGDLSAAASRAGTRRRVVGRRPVLRPVRAALLGADRAPEYPDGDVSAVDVPQAPL